MGSSSCCGMCSGRRLWPPGKFQRLLLHPGFDRLQAGKYEGAIADFDRVINIRPKYTDAYINRADAKSGLGLYEEAVADFDQALQLQPDDASAYISRGNARARPWSIRGGHPLTLIRPFNCKPDDASAYISRGNAKLELGQYQEAIADFDQALQLQPDDASAYISRGNARARPWSRPGGDRRLMIRPCVWSPKTLAFTSTGALPRSSLGQFREAIADYRTGPATASPTTPAHLHQPGRCQDPMLGQYREAIADYRTGPATASPTDVIAYDQSGRCQGLH